MKTGRKPYGSNAAEQAVVGVIKLKRRQRKGHLSQTGPYVIARELNAEGKYKPQRGLVWTGQAVTKILARIERLDQDESKRKPAAKKTMLTADDYLTAEQVEKLLKDGCQSARDEMVVRVLVGSGLRAEEFCELQVRDLGIDGGKSQIDVRHGKGNKARSVFIGPRLAELLRRYRIEEMEKNGRLSRLFGRSYRTLHRLVSRVGKRAGFFGLHPHALRHTFGTILYNYGRDIFFIADQMGHASTDTTRIYAKVLTERKLEQAAIFDRLGLGLQQGRKMAENTGKLPPEAEVAE